MFNAIAPPISWSCIGGCAALVSCILLFDLVYDCDVFVVPFDEFIQFLIVRRDNAFNEAIGFGGIDVSPYRMILGRSAMS